MKTTILLLFTVFLVYPSYAQWGTYESALGADVVVSVPTGDFANAAGTGYGIRPNYVYMFDSNIGFLAEIGYLKWSETSQGSFGSTNYSTFLINAGLKINFIPDQVGPYVFSTLGVHFLKYEYNYSFNYGYGPAYSFSGSGSENKFNLAAGLGYEFEVGDNVYMDLNGNYNHIFFDSNSLAYIGLNAGLRFGLF